MYTNGVDEVSPTAAEGIANAWLAHMFINQLVNDFASTYADSQIIFYGESVVQARQAAKLAREIGYTNVSYMRGSYDAWTRKYVRTNGSVLRRH